jgi:transcriptional regulator with XRE-family HTH domain
MCLIKHMPRVKNSFLNLIGNNLKILRQNADLSQERLAARCQIAGWDIARDTVAKIEGGRRLVTDFEIVKLSRILEVRYEDLLDGPTRRPTPRAGLTN